jgi:hypothetical protein
LLGDRELDHRLIVFFPLFVFLLLLSGCIQI